MPKKIDEELKARSVRLVTDHLGEYPSLTAAAAAVAKQLGVGKESVRRWVIQAQVDGGQRQGATTEDLVEIKASAWPHRPPRLRHPGPLSRLDPPLTTGTHGLTTCTNAENRCFFAGNSRWADTEELPRPLDVVLSQRSSATWGPEHTSRLRYRPRGRRGIGADRWTHHRLCRRRQPE